MLADYPRALKIYIDGSARKNPGGSSGCAGILRYPDDWNRPDEVGRRLRHQKLYGPDKE